MKFNDKDRHDLYKLLKPIMYTAGPQILNDCIKAAEVDLKHISDKHILETVDKLKGTLVLDVKVSPAVYYMFLCASNLLKNLKAMGVPMEWRK